MSEWYREDLAYIHDVGFRSYVLQAMPGILALLKQRNLDAGWVVDLGCGSGLAAEGLVQAGYQVVGVDISEAMVAIARDRVPQAEFQVASLFQVEIPDCQAVISISECFNYLFDPDHQKLPQVFQRIYHALAPGGVFVFDIAEPGKVDGAMPVKSFTEGEDWLVLVEKWEDPELSILTRRIVTLRRVGEFYRRDDEVHRQQLYRADEIASMLQQVGFEVEIQRCYGTFALPHAHAAFVAQKPSN